jgi:LacI family transcriptional regulator
MAPGQKNDFITMSFSQTNMSVIRWGFVCYTANDVSLVWNVSSSLLQSASLHFVLHLSGNYSLNFFFDENSRFIRYGNNVTRMKRKATIVDIAARLGITPSAVSKAFSNHPRISDKTKARVIKAATVLGYVPNSLATGLRKGKSGLIGVVVPGIHYSFFSTAIKGIEEQMTANGYNVVIVQSRDSFELERKQLQNLLRAQVEGIIASIAITTKDHAPFKEVAARVPIVLFDRTFSRSGLSEVTIDDFHGAASAVEHLISMGYKRIAHIAGFSHILPFAKRIEGYKHALDQHGHRFRQEYICECAPNSNEGEFAMERLLSLKTPPDAIFAASDYLAYGAMQVAIKKGFKIPKDIGFVGFSNEEFARQVTPAISTIEQHSEKMGSIAATLLIDQLAGSRRGKNFVVQKKIIEPKLLIRESSLRNKSIRQ